MFEDTHSSLCVRALLAGRGGGGGGGVVRPQGEGGAGGIPVRTANYSGVWCMVNVPLQLRYRYSQ